MKTPVHSCIFCWLDSRTAGDEEAAAAAGFLLGALIAPTISKDPPSLCPDHMNSYMLAFGCLAGTLLDDTPPVVRLALTHVRAAIDAMPEGAERAYLKEMAAVVEAHESTLTDEEKHDGWSWPEPPN